MVVSSTEVVMFPYQARMVEEKRELDDRLARLVAFIGSDKFKELPGVEQYRMNRQRTAMEDYSAMLGERIADFLNGGGG